MKLFLGALAVCSLALTAQDYPAGQAKHLSVPVAASAQPVAITALDVERGVSYPSTINLVGKVEIRMPVCVATGPGTVRSCEGYIILHADKADFHEESGQIEASGNVVITRAR